MARVKIGTNWVRIQTRSTWQRNGSLEVFAMVNGYRVSRVYYGYRKQEALRLFRETVLNK